MLSLLAPRRSRLTRLWTTQADCGPAPDIMAGLALLGGSARADHAAAPARPAGRGPGPAHLDPLPGHGCAQRDPGLDRKSTRLNSSHPSISYAVFCLKKKNYQISNSHQSTECNTRQED